MKKTATLVNRALSLLGLEIIRTRGRMEMFAALKRVRQHGFPVKSIIDIGASDGKWSVKAMSIFPDCRFLAVEPLKEHESALRALKQRVSGFDYALCVAGEDDRATAALSVTADLDGSTVGGTEGHTREVPVRSLDGLVAERGLPGPYLIKFDTHGYEVPILKGAVKTIRNTEVIIMEVYNFQFVPHTLRFHEMCTHLETNGFRCFDMANPALRKSDNAFWQMDLFFTKNTNRIFKQSGYR